MSYYPEHIDDLLNSKILPEYVTTVQAVKFLNNKNYHKRSLYKKRIELKGIKIDSKSFAYPIRELIKLKNNIK